MSEANLEANEPRKRPRRKRIPIPAVTYAGGQLQYYDDEGLLQSRYVEDHELLKILQLLNTEAED